jgi:heptosyltransferase-1
VSLSVLIVKTSSLGDIIQSFSSLVFLHQLFPHVKVDWVVEEKFSPIVAAHPLISTAIGIDRKKIKDSFSKLREKSYDVLFDLQGNSKSALITLFSRAQIKVGFSYKSASEWPNILATHVRFPTLKKRNIRLQYIDLMAQFYQRPSSLSSQKILLTMRQEEIEKFHQITSNFSNEKIIMVCPGSQWVNKQIPSKEMVPFLLSVQKKMEGKFLLVWGSDEERKFCQTIQDQIPGSYVIQNKLSLALWQNLMNFVQLVIAVDSSALHLCGTTDTPSFSVFGPTGSHIFKPLGENHFSLQGKCPYAVSFEKRCPYLRTCETGACMKNLTAEEIFLSFSDGYDRLFLNHS